LQPLPGGTAVATRPLPPQSPIASGPSPDIASLPDDGSSHPTPGQHPRPSHQSGKPPKPGHGATTGAAPGWDETPEDGSGGGSGYGGSGGGGRNGVNVSHSADDPTKTIQLTAPLDETPGSPPITFQWQSPRPVQKYTLRVWSEDDPPGRPFINETVDGTHWDYKKNLPTGDYRWKVESEDQSLVSPTLPFTVIAGDGDPG
jgi:hypothetical protein